MIEKITLDMLTQNSVSVKKEFNQEINGQMQSIGQPWRKAYVNSTKGRQEIEEEVAEPYKSAIIAMWGDNPTVSSEMD